MPIFRRGAPESATTTTTTNPIPPRSRRKPPAARTAPGDGDPVPAWLINAAELKGWSGIMTTLGGFSGSDVSSLIGNMTAASPGMDTWLARAVGESGGGPLATTVLGARTIDRAWAVGTGAWASNVSPEQFKEFHRILREAEELLYQAAREDKASAAPWYFLLPSGRGLSIGLPVIERRFER